MPHSQECSIPKGKGQEHSNTDVLGKDRSDARDGRVNRPMFRHHGTWEHDETVCWTSHLELLPLKAAQVIDEEARCNVLDVFFLEYVCPHCHRGSKGLAPSPGDA